MPRIRRSLLASIVLSLILHGLALLISSRTPAVANRPPTQLEATLAHRPPSPTIVPHPPPQATPKTPQAQAQANKTPPKKRQLAVEKPRDKAALKWSEAQKQEMNKFLDELGSRAKTPPSLAERSLAMAKRLGRDDGKRDEDQAVSLERLPDSPPVDPFSLELYIDSLLKKLNRSAAFVKNDPRSKGLRAASIRIDLNADGSLKQFRVLNAADQQDEIAYVKSVTEQAAPFAPFPPDMRKSARSLTLAVCIMPGDWGSGFGFMRSPEGHACR